MTELQQLQDLYDRNLFLQAYRRTASYWNLSTDVAKLPVEELVFAGRLAMRLGGFRLSRWLFRLAYRRDPGNPRARYFAAYDTRSGWHLFDDLRAFEENSELAGADPELHSWWYSRYAGLWARLRDFERAEACLIRARSFIEPDDWLLSTEAEVRGLADRWPEALEAAERACQLRPDSRSGLQALCSTLVHFGRLEEAAERAAAAAAGTESFEVISIAVGHLAALAESRDGAWGRDTLERATVLLERLPQLAPLADREARSFFARIRLDLADLAGDHSQMARWAEEVRSPYHRRVLENLRNNPQGTRILFPLRRIQQEHLACVPTSISAVLDASGLTLEAEEMAAEMTFGGTVSWAAAEWLEQRGLVVRFFIVNPGVAASLIRNRIPFVMMLKRDDMGHAVAAIGLDEAAGTLLIHDPGEPRLQEYLLQEIRQDGGPLDPEGMAIVQPERAALLDGLLAEADPQVADAFHCFIKADQCDNPAARRNIVEGLAVRYPGHPGTRCLQAMLAAGEGHAGEALAAFQQLLSEFPNSAFLRRNLLGASRALGNLALTRQTLENVVERGILPGVQSGQDWTYPPPTYVCQYADQLYLSAATLKKARSLLNSVIDRYGGVAEAWHILADLLWHEHDRNGALLCYRVGSCLASQDEHYAHAYCTAMQTVGLEDDGLEWLQQRVQQFGNSPWGSGPWITWINTLEDFGHPERALAACQEALQQHGSAPEFLVFATSFLARVGHWEEAEETLNGLQEECRSAARYEAAAQFHRMRGDLNQAIEYTEQWSRHFPYAAGARRQLLDLIAQRDGPRASCELARGWLAARPRHDGLEELYYWELDRLGRGWKTDLLLTRRVKRNPEDAWAWQRLAFRRLVAYDAADEPRRAELQPRIEALLAQCDRTAPDAISTLQARALWLEFRDQWHEAVAGWLETIDEQPENLYNYRRILACCAGLDRAERQRLFEQIEPLLLNCPGRLSFARDLLFLIDERFGRQAAAEAAQRWQQARPDEPELIEGVADLLLTDNSRAAAERALALLQPAVERFPYHVGLRFSLGHAQQRTGQSEAASASLGEIIRRHPCNIPAHLQLARAQHSLGNHQEADRLLDTAASRDPRNSAIWQARVQMLLSRGCRDEALARIQEALQLRPDDVGSRDHAIDKLFELQDEEGAVEAARQGTRLPHRGAIHWWLLATTLGRAPRFAAPGEIEACLRRAIAADASHFQSADALAALLGEQGRHDEAEEVMRRIAPHMHDAAPARGRLAWILFQRGQRDEAIAAMAAAVSQAPWYHWGWNLLLGWLHGLQKWELARTVLIPLAPEMPWDGHLRGRRVSILVNTGLPTEQVDREWQDLLRDFPESVPAHLGRYDWLRANRRPDEAAAVVLAAQALEPDNIYMLARLVEVWCRQGNMQDALQGLQRIWFSGEESQWAAEYAWTAIGRARFDVEGYRDARAAVARGSHPTLSALRLMAAHAMDVEFLNQKARQPWWRTWLPGRGAVEVRALLTMVDRSEWADGAYRAVLLQRWSQFGYRRLVVRYGLQNPAILDADTPVWTEVAGALVALGRKRRARQMLAAWPTRQAVPMAAVVNYLACLPRHGEQNVRHIVATCKEALAKLPHDHCARYLAHLLAEACAVLGDREAFSQTWTEYQRYFTGSIAKGEWFPARDQQLLEYIPHLAKLLEQNQTAMFAKACEDLRERRPLRPAAQAVGAPRWVWYILFGLLLLATLLSIFGDSTK